MSPLSPCSGRAARAPRYLHALAEGLAAPARVRPVLSLRDQTRVEFLEAGVANSLRASTIAIDLLGPRRAEETGAARGRATTCARSKVGQKAQHRAEERDFVVTAGPKLERTVLAPMDTLNRNSFGRDQARTSLNERLDRVPKL